MSKQQSQPNLDQQLRQAIHDSGLSLNELGRRAGIDHGRLSRFMRGERDLTLAAVTKLCDALGLQLVKPIGGRTPAKDHETIAERGSTGSTVNVTPQQAKSPPGVERM